MHGACSDKLCPLLNHKTIDHYKCHVSTQTNTTIIQPKQQEKEDILEPHVIRETDSDLST